MVDEPKKHEVIESVSVDKILTQRATRRAHNKVSAILGITAGFCIILFPLLLIWLSLSGLSSPVHYAMERQWLPFAKALCRLGFREEAKIGFKGGCTTPLQLAANTGNREMVDFLLDIKADVNFRSCKGASTPYTGSDVLTATGTNSDLLIHLIKDRGIDPIKVERGKDAVADAAMKGDGTALVTLIDRARNQNRVAELDLVGMYHGGVGVPKNEAESEKWLQRIVDQDEVDNLARGGGGLSGLLTKAEQGDSYAQFTVSRYYLGSDLATSTKWLRRAADQGIAGAQGAIGEMYRDGKGGLERNYEEGYFWLLLAKKSSGDNPFLSAEAAAFPTEHLTHEQIVDVERRVETWKPTMSKPR